MAETFNLAVVTVFLNTLLPRGVALEFRAYSARRNLSSGRIEPNPDYHTTVGGLYDRPDALACEARSLKGTSGYICPNPINPGLLARGRNKVGSIRKGEGVTNEDIVTLSWLSIDIDPLHKLGKVSATDEERAACLVVRDQILTENPDLRTSALWGAGNGAWILVRLPDHPNDDEHRRLLRHALQALVERYSTARVGIDVNTAAPSRGIGIPGTQKCKGEDLPERPWRVITLDGAGSPVVGSEPQHHHELSPLDLKAWLAAHPLREPQFHRGGAGAPLHPPGQPRRGNPGGVDPHARRLERAENYISHIDAIGNQGGNEGEKQTFHAACVLVVGFDLAVEDAWPIFQRWNQAHADPVWDEMGLRRKLEEADQLPDPRGHLGDAVPADQVRRNGRPAAGPALNGDGGAGGEPEIPGVEGGADPPRPEVVLRHEEYRTVAEACDALTETPNLYQRANLLVRVLHQPIGQQQDRINCPAGTPVIEILPKPQLRTLLTQQADWVRWIQQEGEWVKVPVHPTGWAVDAVATRGSWPVPHLEAVIESPVLRLDGTILAEPGYDARSGLLLLPNITLDPLPDHPTIDDAIAAYDQICDLVCDFPFAEPVDRAVWVSALLTPLARFGYQGPSPLFLFDGNVAGAGKGLLCNLISTIASGRTMGITVYPDSDDEMRKRITSIALEGARTMLIDNIGAIFGGSSLDALLTATTWKDRILGRSETTADLPMTTIWYATGNNVRCQGDILRRLIWCRLRTDYERPELRSDFRHPDLLGHALEHRASLLRSALILLRAYTAAGRPAIPHHELGSFGGWSRLVRSTVQWVSGHDPAETQLRLRQDDPQSQTEARAVIGLLELLHDFGVKKQGLATQEILVRLNSAPDRYLIFRSACADWCRNDDLPSARVLSQNLRRLKDRVFQGLRLVSTPQRNIVRWRVETVQGDVPDQLPDFAISADDACVTSFPLGSSFNLDF